MDVLKTKTYLLISEIKVISSHNPLKYILEHSLLNDKVEMIGHFDAI